MKLPNIMGAVNVAKTFAAAHRPEILLGASVTSTIGSTILAAVGGYKSGQQVLKAENPEFDWENTEPSTPLSTKEKAQLTWTNYAPAGAALVTSLGSTAGLHLVHVKEKKGLVTAGALALEEMKAEYKKWEKENTVGVLSNDEKDKVLSEREGSVPITDEFGRPASHVQDSDGFLEPMYLVRDGKTGRDVWSNQYRIEAALNEVNNAICGGSPVELNYFYTQAGFNVIPDGDALGWSGATVNLKWEETVRDDGRPVRQFIFRPSPEKGFDDAHG